MDEIGTPDVAVALRRDRQLREVDEVLHNVVALYAAVLDGAGRADAASARERLAVASLRFPALVDQMTSALSGPDDEVRPAAAALRGWAEAQAGPATVEAAEAWADPAPATLDRLVDHLASEFHRIRDLL